MPRVSYFRGIVILMFSNEGRHALGHFHAEYPNTELRSDSTGP